MRYTLLAYCCAWLLTCLQLTAAENPRPPKKTAIKRLVDLQEIIQEKLSPLLFKLVTSDEINNKTFQSHLKNTQKKAYIIFNKNLAKIGQNELSDEERSRAFDRIWKGAINKIYEVEYNHGEFDHIATEEFVIKDDDDDDDESEEEKNSSETINLKEELSIDPEDDDEIEKKHKTTLLNILIRRKKSKDHVRKVQTLIENGVSKNLNPEFRQSPRIENQTEYPIRIIIQETRKLKSRINLLDVLLNDQIIYSKSNHIVTKEERDSARKAERVLKTLLAEENKNYVLKTLLEQGDYDTFDKTLKYLEESKVFVTEKYNKKVEGIEDQLACPILEYIFKKMHKIRISSMSTDSKGERIDNIETFIKILRKKRKLKGRYENIFNQYFINRLEHDFNNLFDKEARRIQAYRLSTEILGSNFKENFIKWAKLAHFRNRLAKHLNFFALTASKDSKKSNVIRLIRYANIEDEPLFDELMSCGGRNIIFLRCNRYGWNPVMFAVTKKQANRVELLINQIPQAVKKSDGVGNNILHLAFPLPERLFEKEYNDQEENLLHLIGAEVGNGDIKSKTEFSVKSIMETKSITEQEKLNALRHSSGAGFTPVSLAAATGFYETYDYFIDKLKAGEQWNRDEHSYLAKHVEELLITGMKAYLDQKEKAGLLTEEERNTLSLEIERREKEFEELISGSIKTIYHQEDKQAKEYLKIIMDPAQKILDEHETKKGTVRKAFPYLAAMEAAIKQINEAPDVITKTKEIQDVTEERKEKIIKKAVVKAKKKNWVVRAYKGTKRRILRKPRKQKTPGETYNVHEVTKSNVVQKEVEVENVVKSPIAGMHKSTSAVKASYLSQVFKLVISRYLNHNHTPKHIKVQPTYHGILRNQTNDYFRQHFNATIEEEMQKVLERELRKAGRLEAIEVEDDEEYSIEENDEESDIEEDDDSDSDFDVDGLNEDDNF